MKFWSDKDYTDERGAIIVHRSVQEPTKTDEETKIAYSETFLGKGMVMLQTPQGEMPHEFFVPLDADTITEAFEVFEDQMGEKAPAIAEQSAQEVMAHIQQQMKDQSQSIITPDQIQRTAQFDPNIRG